MTAFINRLFRYNWFPLGFQLITLAGFILLVAGGFTANTHDPAFAKILRNTNPANLIVWSYWWPLIILSAVFWGRVWCMICPVELITSLASRFGFKKQPPAFLRSGWVITLFYLLILFVGIHTLSIHRVPLRMAIYLLLLFATAVVTGLLFSRNAFCAYVCPVGHLLGLYARLAPFGWGVKDSSVCESCQDKSCVANVNAYKFQGRSCGVGLYPPKIGDNTACLLCGQCLKACDRNNPGIKERPNPGWFFRGWFKDLLELKPFTAAQALFVLIVSGFVVYEVFTEWGVTENLLMTIPDVMREFLGAKGLWIGTLVKTTTLFLLLPALIWLFPYVIFRLLGGKLPVSDYLLRFGIAFIPIMAAAHVGKALLKMTSRIPYWEYVTKDVTGISTAGALMDKTAVLAPLPVWRDPLVTIVFIFVMLVAVVLSWTIVRKSIARFLPQAGWRAIPLYLIPLIYGGAFIVFLFIWRVM